MNVLVEHNELVRRALAFILERLGPDAAGPCPVKLVALCDEASMRFNLSPQDALILSRALDQCSARSGRGDTPGHGAPQDLNA